MIKELLTKRKVKKEQEAKYQADMEDGGKRYGMTADEYRYRSSSLLANINYQLSLEEQAEQLRQEMAKVEQELEKVELEIQEQSLSFPDKNIKALKEKVKNGEIYA